MKGDKKIIDILNKLLIGELTAVDQYLIHGEMYADFGLAQLSERERQDLLETLEERYGSGATIVTSQLPISDWHEFLGGGRIADAILDRLVHNAHRIEVASPESMRKSTRSLPHGGHSDK